MPFSAVLFFVFGHLLSVTALMTTAYVVGRRLSMSVNFTDRSERSVVATILGLGAVASLVFALGLLDLIFAPVVLASAVTVNLLGWRVWRELWVERSDLTASLSRSPRTLILVFVVVLPMLLLALYPPTLFDSTLYHLPYAEAFCDAHGLLFLPDLRFPVFPQLQEMLYVVALLGSGDVVAQLIHHLCLLFTAALLLLWGRSMCSSTTGVWAAAAWLGTPLAVWLGGAAYVDLGLTLFVTAALYAWWRWRRSHELSWLLLSAAFVGCAAATKYLGLFFFAALVVATAAVCVPRRQWRALGCFVAVAVAVLAPWYLRIVILTGNPVFPFYPELFGASPWADSAALAVDGPATGALSLIAAQVSEIVRGLGFLFLVPYTAVFSRELFAWQAPISPWLIFLLPVLIVPALISARTRPMLVLVFSYCLFWLTTIRDIRFLLPVLPVLYLALALAAAELKPLRGLPARRWAVVLIALLLVAPGWSYAVYKASNLGPPPLTTEQREHFLDRKLAGHTAISQLNQQHGHDYTVYCLGGEYLRYHAQGRFLGDLYGPARRATVLSALGSGRHLHQRMSELGADHLLVFTNVLADKMPDDPYFRDHFSPVHSSSHAQLYEIRYPANR